MEKKKIDKEENLVYEAISEYMRTYGISLTYRELSNLTGLSKYRVQSIVRALVYRKVLNKMKGVPRSVSITGTVHIAPEVEIYDYSN